MSVTPTHDIKRRLLAGESLMARQVAAEYGVSTALLGAVVKTLRNEGVQITSAKVPDTHGQHAFTAAVVVPDESEWGPRNAKRATGGRRPSTAVVAKRKRNGVAVPHALPTLGADVSVCLLAVGEDGRVSIGLRSEQGTWLTSVDGFSSSDE